MDNVAEIKPGRLVIVRVNYNIHPEALAKLREQFRKQAETGVLIVPPGSEILADVPADSEVDVVAHKIESGDCNPGCANYPTCVHNHGRHGVVRINCPLWRPKG